VFFGIIVIRIAIRCEFFGFIAAAVHVNVDIVWWSHDEGATGHEWERLWDKTDFAEAKINRLSS